MYVRSSFLFLIILPALLAKKPKSNKKSDRSERAQSSKKNKKPKKVRENFSLVAQGPPVVTTPMVQQGTELLPSVVGCLFFLTGVVEEGGPDSFFTQKCTATEGGYNVPGDGIPPGITITKNICELDICLGINEDTNDPDCVYLRFAGSVYTGVNYNTGGQLAMVEPFKATVMGGSGRYLMSQGEALVTQVESGIDIKLHTMPSKENPMIRSSSIET